MEDDSVCARVVLSLLSVLRHQLDRRSGAEGEVHERPMNDGTQQPTTTKKLEFPANSVTERM